MEARAGMLAGPFERSMGLGAEWRVTDVWSGERGDAPDELHIRVAHAEGRAVGCPECGRRYGTYDTRERTWRHPGIWQHGTIVHCAVPRAGRPEHGAHAVRMPWEVRPDSRLAALLEARVLAMTLSGLTAVQMASTPRMSDGAAWRMPGRAVAEAGEAADHSGVAGVGIDDAARGRGQSHVSVMVGLDGQRAIGVAEGRDGGAPGRLAEELEAHGGDRLAIREAARDMSEAHAPGAADALPEAIQTVDRLHASQPFPRATDKARCREARPSEEKGRLPRGTKHCWLRRPENLTGRQAARKASLMGEHLLTARACAMSEAMRAAHACPDRESAGREPDRPVSWC